MDMGDDDDADRVHIKVGEMDPVDSGLMPGLFAEAEKRGFWLRVKNTNVSSPPLSSLSSNTNVISSSPPYPPISVEDSGKPPSGRKPRLE